MAMTIGGRRLSLAWLKPPPVPADGNMTLFEHLRELRYRLVVSVAWILLGMVACAFFYDQLYGVLLRPYQLAIDMIHAKNPEFEAVAVNTGVTTPFTLALKIVGVAGLVLTAPLWLYQVWAFIMPGLLASEKKWSLIFVFSATPLFLLGVAVGYFVLPQGITAMLGFTNFGQGVTSLLEVSKFLDFLIRLMLVFGIAFLLPLVVVLLNVVGVVTTEQLASARLYVVFGCFVFAAIATPSTDPFSMLALALPMVLLYLGAEVVCKVLGRRRARRDRTADAG